MTELLAANHWTPTERKVLARENHFFCQGGKMSRRSPSRLLRQFFDQLLKGNVGSMSDSHSHPFLSYRIGT